MVVHQYAQKEHGLALIRRYTIRNEDGMIRNGRKEWVDMISIVSGIGLCTSRASGNRRLYAIDRNKMW